MSCKSALYTAMQTPTEVAVNGVIPLGSLIRRYGCDITLNGNAVNIVDKGYYDVDASITVAPTAAGGSGGGGCDAGLAGALVGLPVIPLLLRRARKRRRERDA